MKKEDIIEDPFALPEEKGSKPKKKAAQKKTVKKKPAPIKKENKPEDPAPVEVPKQPQEGRDSHGRFTAGHTKTGGIQKGQKQKLSLRIQNQILSTVADEVDSGRFREGLADLYSDDPKSYYQVLASYMKFCAPTLQSQSLEITANQDSKTIDDRLNELMHTTVNK